jgi:hypothetical protein
MRQGTLARSSMLPSNTPATASRYNERKHPGGTPFGTSDSAAQPPEGIGGASTDRPEDGGGAA